LFSFEVDSPTLLDIDDFFVDSSPQPDKATNEDIVLTSKETTQQTRSQLHQQTQQFPSSFIPSLPTQVTQSQPLVHPAQTLNLQNPSQQFPSALNQNWSAPVPQFQQQPFSPFQIQQYQNFTVPQFQFPQFLNSQYCLTPRNIPISPTQNNILQISPVQSVSQFRSHQFPDPKPQSQHVLFEQGRLQMHLQVAMCDNQQFLQLNPLNQLTFPLHPTTQISLKRPMEFQDHTIHPLKKLKTGSNTSVRQLPSSSVPKIFLKDTSTMLRT
jgi:hypothetical protein